MIYYNTLLEILTILIIKYLKKKKKRKIKKKIFINEGKYLVNLGNCKSCHTINGGKQYAGGYTIKTKFGLINTPNITKNKKYGIGNINIKEFKNIIKNGIKKKDFLFPAFPFLNYSKLKKTDIKKIFIYLKNTKEEEIPNKKNKIKWPVKYKKLMAGWRILFFKKKNNKKLIKKKSNIKRGEYIAKTLGHCDMCHGKINLIGKKNNIFKYKNINKIENLKIKEITNNKTKGIKNIKTEHIFKMLKYGISKEKILNGKMAEIVNNSLQYVNKIDLFSISKYIKNIINNNKIIVNKVKKKINTINVNKIFYKTECKKCHGKIKLGNFPSFPGIIKTSNNKLKYMSKKISIINTIKNKYPGIMKKIKTFKTEI